MPQVGLLIFQPPYNSLTGLVCRQLLSQSEKQTVLGGGFPATHWTSLQAAPPQTQKKKLFFLCCGLGDVYIQKGIEFEFSGS